MRLAVLVPFAASSQSAPQSESHLLNTNGCVNVREFGATGNGVTDDLPAIHRALETAAHAGGRILFPAGTYGVSATLVIPTKTQIFGVGRGDPAFANTGSINTVVKALPNFPRGAALVQMGASPAPDFGVQIENMTLDGSSIAGTCLLNLYSEEQSFGRNLVLANCTEAGLRVAGSGAQNSGPYENLEILPGAGTGSNANTRCVEIKAVDAFRGIQGLTCNAGTDYSSRPAIAMELDGTGVYQGIHIEHFATAVVLGNASDPADTLIFAGGGFGPDVTTGLVISKRPRMNNQNLTILGISCSTCKTLLQDEITGTHISDTSLGWYLLGNGAGKNKAILSSNSGVGGQLFGPLRTPEIQLTSAGAKPTCSGSNRGTFWFVQSPPGAADHVQVCSKSAADNYAWATIF